MKRVYIVMLAAILFSGAGFAQKGNNAIGVGGDLGLPLSDFGDQFKTGIGFYAKGMLGVSKAGHITFTSGYQGFKEAGDWEDFTTTVSIIPLLVGYRHNFNGFFIEPQVGYSIFGFKFTTADDGTYTESDGALTGALGFGYIFNKQVEVSARYQTGGKQGTNVNLFGLRLGYNFSPGHSK